MGIVQPKKQDVYDENIVMWWKQKKTFGSDGSQLARFGSTTEVFALFLAEKFVLDGLSYGNGCNTLYNYGYNHHK
jgi:hypothetical protein